MVSQTSLQLSYIKVPILLKPFWFDNNLQWNLLLKRYCVYLDNEDSCCNQEAFYKSIRTPYHSLIGRVMIEIPPPPPKKEKSTRTPTVFQWWRVWRQKTRARSGDWHQRRGQLVRQFHLVREQGRSLRERRSEKGNTITAGISRHGKNWLEVITCYPQPYLPSQFICTVNYCAKSFENFLTKSEILSRKV